jgi:cytochrome c oxidase subunit II
MIHDNILERATMELQRAAVPGGGSAQLRAAPRWWGLELALAAGGLPACEPNGQSVLHPAGPGADLIAEQWWMMLAAASAVFLLVLGVLFRALTHSGRRTEAGTTGNDRGPIRWILAGGVVLPALVLVPLFLLTLQTLADLKAPKGKALEVVITGWQWWWDVEYAGKDPQLRIRTANEVHIPVGQPVRIRLRSGDVIHSFWTPALQGKMDLLPGRVNTTWIQADSAGVFLGECAEYCGLQHTRMRFRVIAQPPAAFATWLEEQRKPATPASDPLRRAGQSVFMSSGCASCHMVRGTPARGLTGPDLTHFATRSTIAAGTLPNSRGHLAGWIGNPQAIKPGNLMPRILLRPTEMQSLLAYLGSLR